VLSESAIVFPPFRLDPSNQQLWEGAKELPLRPKPFAVLAYLAAHPRRLVTRPELVKAVWPDAHVGEGVLRGYIRDLRVVLGDDAEAPRFIETVARRGYRFVAEVGGTSYPTKTSQGAEDPHPSLSRNAHVVGREKELTQLHRCLDKALAGARHMVFVTGEPGIGKTTLVDTFLAQASLTGTLRIARGQCVDHFGVGEAYLPVLEALGGLCRQSGAEVIELLSRHAPTWLIQMPGLLTDTELEAVQRRAQGATQERMLRELAEAVEALTSVTPLALVIEDLQWSDYSTIDLISLLGQRRGIARLLVLGTYRPADVIISHHPLRAIKQELHAHGQCEELPLGCLTAGEVTKYLAPRLDKQSPSKLGKIIHQSTEGNPLFMVNVVDYWANQGLLIETDGQWELTASEPDLSVGIPESLRQMIEKQLERLTPAEQRVLGVASVAGSTFSAAVVAAAAETTVEEVEELCAGLARRALHLRESVPVEWPDGTVAAGYGFLHALYQQVLYERVPVGRRVRLHQQLGQRLEAAYDGRTDQIAVELAVHFERGRAYEQAMQYAWKAADNAARRHAPREAAALLGKALELLEAFPDNHERVHQELALRLALGVPLLMTRGYAAPEVEQTFARARELCKQLTDSPQLLPALAGLYRFYFVRAEFKTARELAEQVLRLAQQTSDPLMLLLANSLLGVSLLNLGDFAPALNHLEQGISLYDLTQHRFLAELYGDDPGVVCLSFASLALWFLGYPDRALQKSQDAVALAQKLSHPYSSAFALSFAAETHVRRRESAAAQKYLEALRTLASEQGFDFFLAHGTILNGWAMTEQQSGDEGIAQMRRGLIDYQATGAKMGLPSHLALLAGECCRAGRTKEGLATVAEALAAVNKTGERSYEAELYRLKGELVLQSSLDSSFTRAGKSSSSQAQSRKSKARLKSEIRSPESEAEGYFHEAIEVARRQGAKSLELRAALSLSRLLKKQGKQKQVRIMLAETYNWFTEGFDTPDLKEAQTLLARS